MGYGVQIPAQLGGPKMAWVIRGYGLSEAWVKRVSTVTDSEVGRNAFFNLRFPNLDIVDLTTHMRQTESQAN